MTNIGSRIVGSAVGAGNTVNARRYQRVHQPAGGEPRGGPNPDGGDHHGLAPRVGRRPRRPRRPSSNRCPRIGGRTHLGGPDASTGWLGSSRRAAASIASSSPRPAWAPTSPPSAPASCSPISHRSRRSSCAASLAVSPTRPSSTITSVSATSSSRASRGSSSTTSSSEPSKRREPTCPMRCGPHLIAPAELLEAVQNLVAEEHFGKRPWEALAG